MTSIKTPAPSHCGRPRQHASAAQRHASFRANQDAKGLHEIRHWVPRDESAAVSAARAELRLAAKQETTPATTKEQST